MAQGDRHVVKVGVSGDGTVRVTRLSPPDVWEGELTEEIRAQMKGRAKAFFYAEEGPHGFLGLTADEAPPDEVAESGW